MPCSGCDQDAPIIVWARVMWPHLANGVLCEGSGQPPRPAC